MKQAYYFSHDTNAHEDPKILWLIQRHGMAGYGRWWVLVEILYGQDQWKLRRSLVAGLGGLMRSDEPETENFIEDLIQIGLLETDSEYVWSPSLCRRMAKRLEVSEIRSHVGKQGALAKQLLSKSLANANTCFSKSLAKSSKEKERKGKERKESAAREREASPDGGQTGGIPTGKQAFVAHWLPLLQALPGWRSLYTDQDTIGKWYELGEAFVCWCFRKAGRLAHANSSPRDTRRLIAKMLAEDLREWEVEVRAGRASPTPRDPYDIPGIEETKRMLDELESVEVSGD